MFLTRGYKNRIAALEREVKGLNVLTERLSCDHINLIYYQSGLDLFYYCECSDCGKIIKSYKTEAEMLKAKLKYEKKKYSETKNQIKELEQK